MSEILNVRDYSKLSTILSGFLAGVKGGCLGSIVWGTLSIAIGLIIDFDQIGEIGGVFVIIIIAIVPGVLMGAIFGAAFVASLYLWNKPISRKLILYFSLTIGLLLGIGMAGLANFLETWARIPAIPIAGMVTAAWTVRSFWAELSTSTEVSPNGNKSEKLPVQWRKVFQGLSILMLPVTFGNYCMIATAVGWSSHSIFEFWTWQYIVLALLVIAPLVYIIGVVKSWYKSWRKWILVVLASFQIITFGVLLTSSLIGF